MAENEHSAENDVPREPGGRPAWVMGVEERASLSGRTRPMPDAENGLTAETLRAAIEKVANAPRRVCGVTEPHVVHPKARGWTACANCFEPVFVCIQESGCDGTSHDIRCNNLRYVTPPADGRDPKPCPRCGEVCKYDGWVHVHANGIGIGSCLIPPGKGEAL